MLYKFIFVALIPGVLFSQDSLSSKLNLAVMKDDVGLVRDLLQQGADPEDLNGGSSAFHLAAGWPAPKVVDFFIEKKCNLELRDIYNVTPLRLAVQIGSERVVRRLLAAGARLDCPGRPLIQIAIGYGHLRIVELLLESGENANKLYDGETALDLALEHDTVNDYSSIIAVLCRYGAKQAQDLDVGSYKL